MADRRSKAIQGLSVGLNKGFLVTRPITKRTKPSYRRGKLGKRVQLVRGIIRELCGLSGYEKRIVELLRTGQDKEAKKGLRIAKSRLGTMRRAKLRVEALENYIKKSKK
jgi:large subunit ribosomal protein L36e